MAIYIPRLSCDHVSAILLTRPFSWGSGHETNSCTLDIRTLYLLVCPEKSNPKAPPPPPPNIHTLHIAPKSKINPVHVRSCTDCVYSNMCFYYVCVCVCLCMCIYIIHVLVVWSKTCVYYQEHTGYMISQALPWVTLMVAYWMSHYFGVTFPTFYWLSKQLLSGGKRRLSGGWEADHPVPWPVCAKLWYCVHTCTYKLASSPASPFSHVHWKDQGACGWGCVHIWLMDSNTVTFFHCPKNW